jgi:hypothetical protein
VVFWEVGEVVRSGEKVKGRLAGWVAFYSRGRVIGDASSVMVMVTMGGSRWERGFSVRDGLGSMHIGKRGARTPSWRSVGRKRGLLLSTQDWVTMSMPSSGRTMKRVAAGVMDDATFQESWERPETRLGA